MNIHSGTSAEVNSNYKGCSFKFDQVCSSSSSGNLTSSQINLEQIEPHKYISNQSAITQLTQHWYQYLSKLTTLSMSFQVFSTVRRSAAACLGGPTASWMASIKPNIRPLLRFGPRPPGFRPLSAAAMSYTLREDRNGMVSRFLLVN